MGLRRGCTDLGCGMEMWLPSLRTFVHANQHSESNPHSIRVRQQTRRNNRSASYERTAGHKAHKGKHTYPNLNSPCDKLCAEMSEHSEGGEPRRRPRRHDKGLGVSDVQLLTPVRGRVPDLGEGALKR